MPLPVRQTPAAKDGRVRDPVKEFLDQAGLADTRRCEDREELTCGVGDGAFERLMERRELAVAPDHRGSHPSHPTGRPGGDGHEAEGLERIRLSLDDEGVDGLGDDRRSDQSIRLVAEQDLARGGSLLESRRDVQRIPGGERLT